MGRQGKQEKNGERGGERDGEQRGSAPKRTKSGELAVEFLADAASSLYSVALGMCSAARDAHGFAFTALAIAAEKAAHEARLRRPAESYVAMRSGAEAHARGIRKCSDLVVAREEQAAARASDARVEGARIVDAALTATPVEHEA